VSSAAEPPAFDTSVAHQARQNRAFLGRAIDYIDADLRDTQSATPKCCGSSTAWT
jgi:hypothetical protein